MAVCIKWSYFLVLLLSVIVLVELKCRPRCRSVHGVKTCLGPQPKECRQDWNSTYRCFDKVCPNAPYILYTATDTIQNFTSEGYPGDYNNSTDIIWVITAPAGKMIKISFIDFDLENTSDEPQCQYDIVSVTNGCCTDECSGDLGVFCGHDENGSEKMPQGPIKSNSSLITIRFTTDKDNNDYYDRTSFRGFKLEYITV